MKSFLSSVYGKLSNLNFFSFTTLFLVAFDAMLVLLAWNYLVFENGISTHKMNYGISFIVVAVLYFLVLKYKNNKVKKFNENYRF